MADRSLEAFTEDEMIDLPSITLEFRPNPSPCAVCETPVSRRWSTENGPVCESCKSWD
ncbi:DUF7573 domain-containing protein [Halocatena halophila]